MAEPEPTDSATTAKPPLNFRIPVEKQTVVQALLSEGLSHRSIEQAVGINRSTIAKISKTELASSEQSARIKKGLRNRWAILAEASLSAIKPKKLKDSSAKDLAYIAAKATEMALGGEASVTETYTQSLKAYMVGDDTQPVVGPGEVVKTVTITKPATS